MPCLVIFYVVGRCVVLLSENRSPLKMYNEIRTFSEMLRAFEHSLNICLVGATAVLITASY